MDRSLASDYKSAFLQQLLEWDWEPTRFIKCLEGRASASLSASELRKLEGSLTEIALERVAIKDCLLESWIESAKFYLIARFNEKGGRLIEFSQEVNCLRFNWEKMAEQSPEALALSMRLEKLSCDASDKEFETVLSELYAERESLDTSSQNMLEAWKVFFLISLLSNFQAYYRDQNDRISQCLTKGRVTSFFAQVIKSRVNKCQDSEYVRLLSDIARGDAMSQGQQRFVGNWFKDVRLKVFLFDRNTRAALSDYEKGYQLYRDGLKVQKGYVVKALPKGVNGGELLRPEQLQSISLSSSEFVEPPYESWFESYLRGEEKACAEIFSWLSGGEEMPVGLKRFMGYSYKTYRERVPSPDSGSGSEEIARSFLPPDIGICRSPSPTVARTPKKKRWRPRKKPLQQEDIPVVQVERKLFKMNLAPALTFAQERLKLGFVYDKRVVEWFAKRSAGEKTEDVEGHSYPRIITRLMLSNTEGEVRRSRTRDKPNHLFWALGSIQREGERARTVVFGDCFDQACLYHHFAQPISQGEFFRRLRNAEQMVLVGQNFKNPSQELIKLEKERFLVAQHGKYRVSVTDRIERLVYTVCFPKGIKSIEV